MKRNKYLLILFITFLVIGSVVFGNMSLTIKAESNVYSYNPSVAPELLGKQLLSSDVNVIDMAVSPEGDFAVFSSSNGKIRIWNIKKNEIYRDISESAEKVGSVSFSKDGSKIAFVSGSKKIKIWDMKLNKVVREIKTMENIKSLHFIPGENEISFANKHNIKVKNIENSKKVNEFHFAKEDKINYMKVSLNGKMLAAGGGEKLKIWDLNSGSLKGLLKPGGSAGRFSAYTSSVAISPDSKYIVTGGSTTTIKIWNISEGKIIREIRVGTYFDSVNDIEFSPRGDYIAFTMGKKDMARSPAYADKNGIVKIHNVKTGENVTTFELTHPVNPIEFSLKENILFFGTDTTGLVMNKGKTTVQAWDLQLKDISSIDMEMVKVSRGTTSEDNGGITLDYDIEVGKNEVTHANFIKFLNDVDVSREGTYKGLRVINNKTRNFAIDYKANYYFSKSNIVKNIDCPVMGVTWYGAIAYCNWLSLQKGFKPAYILKDWENGWELRDNPENVEGYRLPTIAEWEYVARGGKGGDATTYAGSDNPDEVAWYNKNRQEKDIIHPVQGKKPNELGIYDMSGNLSEWLNNNSGEEKIIKGGNFLKDESDSKLNHSRDISPYRGLKYIGLRVVRTK